VCPAPIGRRIDIDWIAQGSEFRAAVFFTIRRIGVVGASGFVKYRTMGLHLGRNSTRTPSEAFKQHEFLHIASSVAVRIAQRIGGSRRGAPVCVE